MEQRKHSGKCVYHLCDNHSTSTCNVKLECEKLLAEKLTAPSSSSSYSGQLHHITEEIYEDAIDMDSRDVESDDMTNNTNRASLHYYARVTNHYLCLVRSSDAANPRHAMKYPIITDSGANHHMFCDLIFFHSIVPATGRVILGDGKTSLNIEGIGTVKLKFGESILVIDNVRYIPSLAESIYSLFVHIQNPGHAVHSSFTDGLSIIFLDFESKALIGSVERKFEELLFTLGTVHFMGQVGLFLGIKFTWVAHPDGHLTVSLTQQSFTEILLDSLAIDRGQFSMYLTPYRSNCCIDSIPSEAMSATACNDLRLHYQSLVGSLIWLAHTTRPDILTIVSLLAQHQSEPSPGHYEAAKYVAEYLASTKTSGIYFTSCQQSSLESFLHFPVPQSLVPMTDANWGLQDASLTSYTVSLPLFVSQSMSAFYMDLLGPLHWMSKCQKVTAASSAEAEIYATNECIKVLLELEQLLSFLDVKHIFMPDTTIVYNDNNACVQWSRKTTTKGL